MKAKMLNNAHVEGYLYEHKLEIKTSGPNSKAPGTQFINGTISIATDDECTNIVPIHYTYVVANTKSGGVNQTYVTLSNIANGSIKTVMSDGIESAAKVRADTTLSLNDFYVVQRSEYVSSPRYEGGFIHLVDIINPEPAQRNYFSADMVLVGVTRLDADPEREIPERVQIKGFVFDFRNAFLPMNFMVYKTEGMDYFENIGATASDPIFLRVNGCLISKVISNSRVEEVDWGDKHVKTTTRSVTDWIVVSSKSSEEGFGAEETMTMEEFKKGLADRELFLATVKNRAETFAANNTQATPTTPVSSTAPDGGFKF